jgi:hypothetical protein
VLTLHPRHGSCVRTCGAAGSGQHSRDVGADSSTMKTMLAICITGVVAVAWSAEDAPIDPRDIYDKLDTKKYERVLPAVGPETVSTFVEYATNAVAVPFATLTNDANAHSVTGIVYAGIALALRTQDVGVAGGIILDATNVASANLRSRSWTIRGSTFSNLIYFQTIEKNGKRLVYLAPPGLGIMAVPIEDLGPEDIRAVEVLERTIEALKRR